LTNVLPKVIFLTVDVVDFVAVVAVVVQRSEDTRELQLK